MLPQRVQDVVFIAKILIHAVTGERLRGLRTAQPVRLLVAFNPKSHKSINLVFFAHPAFYFTADTPTLYQIFPSRGGTFVCLANTATYSPGPDPQGPQLLTLKVFEFKHQK